MSDYIMGIDWVLVEHPITQFAVIDSQTKIVEGYTITNTDNLRGLLDRIKQLNAEWQPRHIWLEQGGSGQVIVEELLTIQIPIRPFPMTAMSKVNLAMALKHAIESGEIKFLDSVKQSAILQADEGSMALALAWHGVNQQGMSINFD